MFHDLDPSQLAGRRSVKWTRYGDDVLAAWVADMDFPIAPPIKRALQATLDLEDVGYPGYDLRDAVRSTFVERMTERFGWTPSFDHTRLITTVVQGLHVALELTTEPGAGVLVQPPVYHPFLDAIADMGRRQVDAPLVYADSKYEIDIDGFRRALTEGVRAFMLCNPHNPAGRVFTADELRAMAEALADYDDIIVISDEIHQDLVFPGSTHEVFARIAPELADRTITLTSASKAFNLAGNRCAIAHFGSDELLDRWERKTSRLFGEVSLAGHVSTLAAWREPESDEWFTEMLDYIDGNRQWLATAVAERLLDAVYSPPEGTYLAWVDLSSYELGDDPATALLERAQLALSTGPQFGAGGEGHVRINMATSRPILEEVVDRMAAGCGL